MMRSRLPVPSLLRLFVALQDLPGNLSYVPVTNPKAKSILAFAVMRYNADRRDSPYYFKQLGLLKAVGKGVFMPDYFLNVDMVKTTCRKKAGRLSYIKIQECGQGKNKKEIICFKVTYVSSDIMYSQHIPCD